jgi:hypothetical protein
VSLAYRKRLILWLDGKPGDGPFPQYLLIYWGSFNIL